MRKLNHSVIKQLHILKAKVLSYKLIYEFLNTGSKNNIFCFPVFVQVTETTKQFCNG